MFKLVYVRAFPLLRCRSYLGVFIRYMVYQIHGLTLYQIHGLQTFSLIP